MIEPPADRIMACWIGKNAGGTLGAPYEGEPGPHTLQYYNPVPRKPLPNDDLELQLLWLVLAERRGWGLGYNDFAQAWLNNIPYDMDEYGIARWNLKRGLGPPLSGLHNNWFTDGMGAAIRSEIWACLFPEQPETAAHFAALDASVDHAGEGIRAEIFLAAAESAAFSCTEPAEGLQGGLEVLEEPCRIGNVVEFVMDLYQRGTELGRVREEIMGRFGSPNFTDCVMNVGFITAALLYGEKEFGRTILTAVNFGMDSDCTGATAGAFLGIMLGESGIDSRWRQPLGDKLVCHPDMASLAIPDTVQELTRRTTACGKRMQENRPADFSPRVAVPDVRDNADDGHRWRLVTGSSDLSSADLDGVESALTGSDVRTVSFPGIHLDLSEHVEKPEYAVCLASNLIVPGDVEGFLMVASEAPCVGWLDGRKTIEYHGRRAPVPAPHRTEGGVTVPVNLEADRQHRLILKLSFFRPEMRITVALCDSDMAYVSGFRFEL